MMPTRHATFGGFAWRIRCDRGAGVISPRPAPKFADQLAQTELVAAGLYYVHASHVFQPAAMPLSRLDPVTPLIVIDLQRGIVRMSNPAAASAIIERTAAPAHSFRWPSTP
jgi:hypothetical protein